MDLEQLFRTQPLYRFRYFEVIATRLLLYPQDYYNSHKINTIATRLLLQTNPSDNSRVQDSLIENLQKKV